MRGRKALCLLIVSILMLGMLPTMILLPVQAQFRNVGIASVGATHTNPIRVEQGPESIVLTAYNNGTQNEKFNVTAYYYNATLSDQVIGTATFQLNAVPGGGRNQTEKVVNWDLTSVAEGTYFFKAKITWIELGDDDLPGDNERTSLSNAEPRQRQLGIIRGHNVGVAMVKGSSPRGRVIRAGDPYTIAIEAYNNGYYNESFTVTTYYNRSGAPNTFVPINTTSITNLVNRTGTKAWTIVWTNASLLEDHYTVSSNASVVSGEKIDYDQNYVARDTVDIIRHDIAVLDVIAAPTGVPVGQTVKVNVTVQNQGVETESFNVRAYANDTLVAAQQAVSNLAPLNDRFRINQTVATASWSPLRSWTDGLGSDEPPYHPVPLDTYAWSFRPEPNDGSWSWTDVSNIRVRFESDVLGAVDNFEIKMYEVWATVYRNVSGVIYEFESRPTAHIISGISVTDPTQAYDANPNTYASFMTNADGYIEFKTFTTSTDPITRVDIKIKYSALKIVKVLTFNWGTTGWATGFYVLNGTADFVPGEILQRQDNSYENPDVRRRVNIPPSHDVASTFGYTNQTYATPGDKIAIYATVENQGDANENPSTNFYVRPYYFNQTFSAPAAPSQGATVSCRNNTGEDYPKKSLTFVWDTTGVSLGSYTIKIVASTVTGETRISNNNYTDGRVIFTRLYIYPARTISDVSNVYKCRPTSYTIYQGLPVTNPGNAFDNDNATYASFLTNTNGAIEYITFTTPGLTTNVAQVDVKIRYSALAVPVDRIRINQSVSPSTAWSTLRDWTAARIYASTYVWPNRPEPNNGTWEWSDVANINVKFESDQAIAEHHTVRIYEVWATIYRATGLPYQSSPTAHEISGITVSYPTRAYDKNNATYAYFSTTVDGTINFKAFNVTGGTGAITRVDIKIRYELISTADKFMIQDTVSPSTSYSTLRPYTTSDVNVPVETGVWSYRPEPNDGNWSWTDVSKIKIMFTGNLTGTTGENREIRIYEIWATVYDKPFTIELKVGGVLDLYAWSVRMHWDPSVIDATRAAEGIFLTGPEGTIFSVSINHTGGYADISQSIVGMHSGTSGSGILSKIVFKVIKQGKSTITLSDTNLVNSFNQPMDHYVEGGKFNTVPLTGDLDGDGDVDVLDLKILNQAYGSTPGKPNWNPAADLNGDNVVDVKDLRILGKNWW